jgi:hypothetical protein
MGKWCTRKELSLDTWRPDVRYSSVGFDVRNIIPRMRRGCGADAARMVGGRLYKSPLRRLYLWRLIERLFHCLQG